MFKCRERRETGLQPGNPPKRNVSPVEHKQHILGRVLICAKWTAITLGVLLSPVFVVFMVWLIGWSVHRWLRLWEHRRCGRLGLIEPTDASKFHKLQYGVLPPFSPQQHHQDRRA